MKYFLLILTVFVSCQFSLAQQGNLHVSTVKKSLSDAEFLIAKEGYLKMCRSDLYKAQREASLEIAIKLAKVQNLDFFEKDEDYSKWISTNLGLTEFKSIEEAIELRKLCVDLQERLEEENSEVFELLSRASVEQAEEILKPERLTFSEISQFKVD